MAAGLGPGQHEFWNGAPGQMWVTHQVALDAMHASVTDLLLAAAAPEAGERILDIGCGAGATTLAFAAAVGPCGHVTGLDISEPLLAHARARAAGVANVSFELADAATWEMPGEVDAVISRFGLMFFSEPAEAFRNIARPLRPGVRMVFAAWAGPDRNPWFALPLEAAVARVGPVPGISPDAPGPMAFRDIARVTGILEAAGFDGASGEVLEVELHHPGGVDAAAALATHIGPAARAIRDAGGGDADARAVEADLRGRLAAFGGADGVRIPAAINLFRAVRG